MNLEAAHAFSLAAYGNLATASGLEAIPEIEDHPVFLPPSQTMFRLKEDLIAQSPAEFFQRLIKDEVASCTFTPISIDRPMRPYKSAMFLGGGNWGIETAWDRSHIIWFPQWEADDSQMPMVCYQGMPVDDRPAPKPVLAEAMQELMLKIEAIHDLLPEHLTDLRSRLQSAISTAQFEDQTAILLPEVGYAPPVHAAVNVCGQAFIFDSQTRLPNLIEVMPEPEVLESAADDLLEAILRTLSAASASFTLAKSPEIPQ